MATYNFFGAATPGTSTTTDGAVNLGLRIANLVAGTITKVRFWAPAAFDGSYTVAVYNDDTPALVTSQSVASPASGWNEVTLSSPVAMTIGVTYRIVLFTSGGSYGATTGYSWPVTTNGGNYYTASFNAGSFTYNGSLTRPTTNTDTNFFVDVVIDDGASSGTTGTGDSTLAALTSTSAGSPVVTGSGTPTLAALSASSTATPVMTGSATPTLSALSSSSTASPVVSGTGTATLAALSASSAGSPVITAATTVTLDALTASSAGTPRIVGSGSPTLDALVSAGTDSLSPAIEFTLSGVSGGVPALSGQAVAGSRTLIGGSTAGVSTSLQGHA